MSSKTDAQLSTEAQQIKNETAKKANSASRVGTHLQNLVDSKVNKNSLVKDWAFPDGAFPTERGVIYVSTDDTEATGVAFGAKLSMRESAPDEGPYNINHFAIW